MPAPIFVLPVTGADPKTTAKQLLEDNINAVLGALYGEISSATTGLNPRGGWDASSGSFPTGSTAGDYWVVSGAGTVDGAAFLVGDWVVALVADASGSTYDENWFRADYSQVAPKEYASIPALALEDAAIDGETKPVISGFNGEREYFTFVAGGTKTADEALVVDGVGGQWESDRTVYADYDEFSADPRELAAGTVTTIVGITASFTATDGAGNMGAAKPTGQKFDVWSINNDVRAFGPFDDGTTYSTARLQAALNVFKDKAYFKAPSVGYKVSTLELLDKQTLHGDNMWSPCLIGDGTGPVLKCGDGVGTIREHYIHDLHITNNGERCVHIDYSPNSKVQRCYLYSTGADALDIFYSWRCTVVDNFIFASGAFNAIRALDNVNSLLIDNNTVSGGSAGRAILVGQCQSPTITNNTIESCLHGIWVASTSETGDGNCNGVDVSDNYIEQCSTPIVLGKQFTVLGFSVENNIIGNTKTFAVSDRTAWLTHGRIRKGKITDNTIYVSENGDEDLVNTYLNVATGDVEDVFYARNHVDGTPAANLVKFGTYAANASVNNTVGAEVTYDFGVNMKSRGVKTYTSPTIYANKARSDVEYLDKTGLNFGGQILSARIIEAEGTLTGAQVSIGDSTTANRTVALTTLTSLTFTRGKADLTTAFLDLDLSASGYQMWRSLAGAGTGSFRLEIKYRAD
jgi:hypothetical protein